MASRYDKNDSSLQVSPVITALKNVNAMTVPELEKDYMRLYRLFATASAEGGSFTRKRARDAAIKANKIGGAKRLNALKDELVRRNKWDSFFARNFRDVSFYEAVTKPLAEAAVTAAVVYGGVVALSYGMTAAGFSAGAPVVEAASVTAGAGTTAGVAGSVSPSVVTTSSVIDAATKQALQKAAQGALVAGVTGGSMKEGATKEAAKGFGQELGAGLKQEYGGQFQVDSIPLSEEAQQKFFDLSQLANKPSPDIQIPGAKQAQIYPSFGYQAESGKVSQSVPASPLKNFALSMLALGVLSKIM